MRKLFTLRTILVFIFIVIAVFVVRYVYQTKTATPDWVTAKVERGTVSEVVAVSGYIEALKTADLSFPSAGLVTGVLVKEGDKVEAGQVLATLGASQLVAERAEAMSALTSAEAAYQKTVSGPRSEIVTVAKTSLNNAEENLARVTSEENRKVKNAKAALLSTGLTAVSTEADERGVPPTVSGTYNCEAEGSYLLEVYGSAANSGYSYRLTGLETTTGVVSVEQPAPLGTCGLYLLFTAGAYYSNSEWKIEIPNTRSSSYTSLNNAYNLAFTQAGNAITAAKNTLALANDEAALSTAPARQEEVIQANAAITQAKARIAAIDAKLTDRSIVAPFSGIVTDISVTEGESAQSKPVITVLADDAFHLKARVPEIDITKIDEGQNVIAIFDARTSEPQVGKVVYISPAAIQIDGVAYFETTIELGQSPTWLRAGLNADVNITTDSKTDVLRLPKRFVITNPDGSHVVLRPQGGKTATTSIEVIFVGNDSFLEITGLAEGETVIAP